MPTPIPPRYALDLTGVNANNLVLGEVHSLSAQKIRSLAPIYGPYFTESLKVYDHLSQQILSRNLDYQCLDIVGLPTAQSGKEICSIIVITNPNVGQQVRINYQALGGGYERSYEAIKLLMENLTNDTRPVDWPNILNRPTEFEPTMHLHRLGDVIGFEYVVSVLEQLKNSIVLGDQLGHDEILSYIDYNLNILMELINNAQGASTVLALSRATNANNSAVGALQSALETAAQVETLEASVQETLVKANDLLRDLETSEEDARYLISSYPYVYSLQSVANLNTIPSVGFDNPLLFPLGEATGLISRDYYAIDVNGKIINGVDDDADPNNNNDLVFMVDLSAHKLNGSGQAQLKLKINLFDQRTTGNVGYYGKDCVLKLYPFQFDDGNGDLISTSCLSASYLHSEAPFNGVLAGITYGVNGVDANSTISMKANESAVAARIGQYLLDCRSDYNVKDYGSVTQRRGITLNLNPGTELNFTFNLKGVSINEIRKTVFLNFSQSFKLMQTNTIVKDGIDKNRVRGVSVKF